MSFPTSPATPTHSHPRSGPPVQRHRVLHAALVVLLVGFAALLFPLSASAESAPSTADEWQVRSFQLQHVNVSDMVTILRSIAGVKHLAANEGSQVITLRADRARLELAAHLVERHDRPPSLVVLDVEVVSVPRDDFDRFDRRGGERLAGLSGVVRLGEAELGLVGRRPGELRLHGLRHGPIELRDLKLQAQARLGEAGGGDMVLRLGVDAEMVHGDHGPSALETSTRRVVGEGGEIALELPVGTADDERALVLLLTPRPAEAP